MADIMSNDEGLCYFIGVDVGTKSVRAGLISSKGKILKTYICSLHIFNPEINFYEQSSSEIWTSICLSVKKLTEEIDIDLVKGIGFDATCSLVILDQQLFPLSLDHATKPSKQEYDACFNIIMWMDHRALEEANLINLKSHDILKYVGGKISLEMEMPKLLWLKKNQPTVWQKVGQFIELPDFLTFKATGNLSRSLCSSVCKWNYHPIEAGGIGWNRNFLSSIELEDLCNNDCEKIGKQVFAPGECCGYLTDKAAKELGLLPGTPVGASLIDAHAGGLALMAAGLKTSEEMIGRLALICGTSTCHMCISKKKIFSKGIWGPFYSVMINNLWTSEGGQSATGCLVDHIVNNHPAVTSCPKNEDVYAWLESLLKEMMQQRNLEDVAFLSKEVHVYPDFHGNRSPIADSTLKGMISGLTLDNGEQSLALLYLATIQSLAYGTKDIVEQLTLHGHEIKAIPMCGGLSKSKLFIQTHADVMGLPVLIPENKESVLLGAAMLGATASKYFGPNSTLEEVAVKMGGNTDTVLPNQKATEFHKKKYQVFKKMQNDQIVYREIMK